MTVGDDTVELIADDNDPNIDAETILRDAIRRVNEGENGPFEHVNVMIRGHAGATLDDIRYLAQHHPGSGDPHKDPDAPEGSHVGDVNANIPGTPVEGEADTANRSPRVREITADSKAGEGEGAEHSEARPGEPSDDPGNTEDNTASDLERELAKETKGNDNAGTNDARTRSGQANRNR